MTVGELKAALEGKNENDLVQVIPNYMINIIPAKQEPVEVVTEGENGVA